MIFNRPLIPYLLGIAAWFATWGLQFVMLPTIALIYLQVGAAKLALLQIMGSIPQILFLLSAGRVADHNDGRKILVLIHSLMLFPPLAIFWLLWSAHLTYWHMLIFSFSMGLFSSLSMPARDALLSRVDKKLDIQKAVMFALLAQFGAQLFGYILAGAVAPFTEIYVLPAMQFVILLIGLGAALALPSFPPIDHENHKNGAITWRNSLKIIYRSQTLLPVILGNMAVGILFVGLFMVGLPIIVRENFNGGQLEFSILNFCFWGGTIFTSILMMRRKPVHRQGRALCIATFLGSISLLLMASAPNFLLFSLCATLWGLCAGANMAMSRTVVQTNAPAYLRGRVLALYTLGFMGSAPLGAWVTGLIAEYISPQTAPLISGLSMIIFITSLIIFTSIWRIERIDPPIETN